MYGPGVHQIWRSETLPAVTRAGGGCSVRHGTTRPQVNTEENSVVTIEKFGNEYLS